MLLFPGYYVFKKASGVMRFIVSVCRWAAGIFLASAAFGQELPPSWEVQAEMKALIEQVTRISPLVAQAKPADWVRQGAPEAYLAQWQQLKNEIEYALASAAALEKQPERLTLALETYFRLDSAGAMLASLSEGIAKYQNPAVADLLRGAWSESAQNREKLKRYIVQLAGYQEAQFEIVNREAQKCRAIQLQPTPQRKAPAN